MESKQKAGFYPIYLFLSKYIQATKYSLVLMQTSHTQSHIVQPWLAFRFDQSEIIFQTPSEQYADVKTCAGFYLMHSHI